MFNFNKFLHFLMFNFLSILNILVYLKNFENHYKENNFYFDVFKIYKN